MIRTWALLAALAAAPPAQALDVPARAEAELAQGRPFVDVTPDERGESGLIRAAIDVPAPREVVWTLMTDCALATKFVANLRSCRVLERSPDGRSDVREEISKRGVFRAVRTVYRETFEKPERMSFRRIDGDLKVFEGEWRLIPRGGGITRVTYEAKVAAPFAVPGWLSRMELRVDLPNALTALRREAIARGHDG